MEGVSVKLNSDFCCLSSSLPSWKWSLCPDIQQSFEVAPSAGGWRGRLTDQSQQVKMTGHDQCCSLNWDQLQSLQTHPNISPTCNLDFILSCFFNHLPFEKMECMNVNCLFSKPSSCCTMLTTTGLVMNCKKLELQCYDDTIWNINFFHFIMTCQPYEWR